MLTDDLKVLLGSTFVLYTKTHGFHFNVEGSNFPQYHKFLKTFYEDVYETIDVIGEYIRTLNSYAPNSLSRMVELSVIAEQDKIPKTTLMFEELLVDSTKMVDLAKHIFDVATEAKEQGIANFMADLQDLYAKKAWMLRSTLKNTRE
jgi:starvation-inducible DNA-binding protein